MSIINCQLPFLRRLRHYRGHGIHSPLVYALKREVFMRRQPASGELYEALRAYGVRPRHAREISALRERLQLGRFTIEGGAVRFSGRALCVLDPRRQKQHYRQVLGAKNALSIDRRGYALFLYDSALPKQHFIL